MIGHDMAFAGIMPTYMQGMKPIVPQQEAPQPAQQPPARPKPSYYAQTVDRNGIVVRVYNV